MILHQAFGSIVNPRLSLCQANVKTPGTGSHKGKAVEEKDEGAVTDEKQGMRL